MNVKDGIIGLIVGDALGVPHEFKSVKEMKRNPVTTMMGYGTHRQPIGTWSDDSSMTLATMGSIIKNEGKVSYDSLMKEFVRWYANGDYTQYSQVFDIGLTTEDALMNYVNGTPPLQCGLKGERNQGNGSLMRILPLAYLDYVDYDNQMTLVGNVSSLTHSHPTCIIACNYYVDLAKRLLNDTEHDYSFCDHVIETGEAIHEYYKDESSIEKFDDLIGNIYTGGVQSSGYVMNTLESALYCIKKESNFKDTLLRAVNMGGDTDTLCAVCGGLAGIHFGYDDIPSEWIACIPSLYHVHNMISDFEEVIL